MTKAPTRVKILFKENLLETELESEGVPRPLSFTESSDARQHITGVLKS